MTKDGELYFTSAKCILSIFFKNATMEPLFGEEQPDVVKGVIITAGVEDSDLEKLLIERLAGERNNIVNSGSTTGQFTFGHNAIAALARSLKEGDGVEMAVIAKLVDDLKKGDDAAGMDKNTIALTDTLLARSRGVGMAEGDDKMKVLGDNMASLLRILLHTQYENQICRSDGPSVVSPRM